MKHVFHCQPTPPLGTPATRAHAPSGAEAGQARLLSHCHRKLTVRRGFLRPTVTRRRSLVHQPRRDYGACLQPRAVGGTWNGGCTRSRIGILGCSAADHLPATRSVSIQAEGTEPTRLRLSDARLVSPCRRGPTSRQTEVLERGYRLMELFRTDNPQRAKTTAKRREKLMISRVKRTLTVITYLPDTPP